MENINPEELKQEAVKIFDPKLTELLLKGKIFHKIGTNEYLALKKYKFPCIVDAKTLKFHAIFLKDIQADYDPKAITPSDRLKLFLFNNL